MSRRGFHSFSPAPRTTHAIGARNSGSPSSRRRSNGFTRNASATRRTNSTSAGVGVTASVSPPSQPGRTILAQCPLRISSTLGMATMVAPPSTSSEVPVM